MTDNVCMVTRLPIPGCLHGLFLSILIRISDFSSSSSSYLVLLSNSLGECANMLDELQEHVESIDMANGKLLVSTLFSLCVFFTCMGILFF